MKKKVIDEGLILFDKLFTEQERYNSLWKKYERLFESKHEDSYYKILKGKKRSRLFVPVTRNTINIITAIFSTAFFSRGNPIEIFSHDEKEKELISYRNKVLTYYYDKYKPTNDLIKAFQSALIFGMGIVITYWDNKKEKIITTQIPITDIAFDHECTSINDIEVLGYKHYESKRIVTQKIDNKYYDKESPKELKEKLFTGENSVTTRFEIKVLYTRINSGWEVKTYINTILVKETTFATLPFQYGHAIPIQAKIDSTLRKNQILCYGDTIPNYLSPLQQEINYKRNVKNDIQEKILNPDVYVSDKAKIDPSDLTYGAGNRIRVKGSLHDIQERSVPSEYALNNDLSMLAGDVQSAVGVNSIQEGETGASDRRSATAMAVINSNSSMRIEQMILLLKETLFEHWAKLFVKLVMTNASDEIIHKVTGTDNFPLGVYGERDSIEYDLKINFGMTLDKQQKINAKLQAYQIASQDQSIKPEIKEGLLKDLLNLIVGDDTNLTDLFEKNTSDITQEKPSAEEIQNMIETNNMVSGAV